MSRWQILLRNPKRPNLPPQLVKTVTEPDGSFRPLDSRTIHWLYEADMHRRFHGYNPDQFGKLMEEQISREQEELDREKKRKADDMWSEVFDRAKFECRKLDRRSQLVK